jgi:hypothetical protein
VSFKGYWIWRGLQKYPGLSTTLLAEALGMDAGAVSDSLRLLRLRGSARAEGFRTGSAFHAEWYATELEPVDGRGRGLGSTKALAANKLPWPEALKMANKARIKRKVKPPKKPAAFSTELERCWPRPRVLRQIGQDD